jgi:DNA ligase-associated metallophosphoesterase
MTRLDSHGDELEWRDARLPSGTGWPPGAVHIAIGGERALLLPERALWLPAHDAVLVADLHWGKAAAFRAAQVPVPAGTTADDLARLSQLLTVTEASRLVVLGDLLHAREGRHSATLARIAEWRERHAAVRIDLVRGNHDARAGDPPASLGIACHDGPLAIGGLLGVHDPASAGGWRHGRRDAVGSGEAPRHLVAGHLHPTVVLRGRGRQRLRLPCFVIGTGRTVLPAFSSFTGGGMYEPAGGDRCYAIADGDVLAVG